MKSLFLFAIYFQFLVVCHGQEPTMGLLFNNELSSFDGYTLIAPTTSTNSYLIDNCGKKVHEWESSARPGLSSYLLENGVLLRTEKETGSFFGGGLGGKVKMIDWDGTVLWDYTFANDDFHQHHDIEPLPNGNILMIAWERVTAEEIIAKGRIPETVEEEVWLTYVVEIEPNGLNEGNIVWEWHLLDHLSQDFDETQENFTIISEHPELVNINYGLEVGGVLANIDWVHANAIDYNPVLDQISLSSRHYSEVWIIDHSTTTEEAAAHEGGNSGKGGDLLYRWGNPRTYNRGTDEDQILFGQHNVQWIEEGLVDEGKLMVFNNLGGSMANSSAINIWSPPLDENGHYLIDENLPIGPVEADWTFEGTGQNQFYSVNVSGVQRLPNGNTLICVGREGRIIEITPNEALVWNYINPILSSGPGIQGNSANGNTLFRATRYSMDYPAFIDKDLTAGDPLELEFIPNDCGITPIVNTNFDKLIFFPNPTNGNVWITNEEVIGDIRLTNILGELVLAQEIFEKEVLLDLSLLEKGIYFIYLKDESSRKIIKF